MIERMRAFFRDQPPGIAYPVGFILLYGAWQFIYALVGGIFYPFVFSALTKGEPDLRLDFNSGGIFFDATIPFIDGVAFVALALVVYFGFVRVVPSDDGEEWGMRECPECKSLIFDDATRCAFCTSEVTPLREPETEE